MMKNLQVLKKSHYFAFQSTFIMTENHEHLAAIHDIRNMMKRSTRFLSLSGMSGVLAGIYALAGAVAGNWLLNNFWKDVKSSGYSEELQTAYLIKFAVVAALVLAASLGTGIWFSKQKAKKAGQKLFDHSALRLVFNLVVPLGTAGIFCIMLYKYELVALIGPAMLVFYGLALLNASKYTLDEILYLGISEILLGLVNGMWFLGYGLYFWAFGFGVLHIVYGLIMWYKYDRRGTSERG